MWIVQKNEVVQRLKEHADAIKSIGARSLYLFGSTARGEALETSDADLFVEYDEDSDFSAIELIRIKHDVRRRVRAPLPQATKEPAPRSPRRPDRRSRW